MVSDMSWIDKILEELVGKDENGLSPKQKLKTIIAKYRISGDRVETKLNLLLDAQGLKEKRLQADKYFDDMFNAELRKILSGK